MIGVHRLMIASAERSDLSAVLRAEFIDPNWRRFSAVLEREMAAGKPAQGRSVPGEHHFSRTGGGRRPGAPDERLVTKAQVETAVEQGDEAFLRAYAP